MFLKKCSCGSTQFIVSESYYYKAELDEEGNLDCGKSDGGVDSIECVNCKTGYSFDHFNQINF